MASATFRSTGRNLSFDLLNFESEGDDQSPSPLSRSSSDPINSSSLHDLNHHDHNRRHKKKKKKKHKKKVTIVDPISEVVDEVKSVGESSFCVNEFKFSRSLVFEEVRVLDKSVELRQRSVNGNVGSSGGAGVGFDELERKEKVDEEEEEEERRSEEGKKGGIQWREELSSNVNGNGVRTGIGIGVGVIGPKLETEKSLDWKHIMAEDPTYLSSMEKSPLKYFMGEMSSGNSLRSTTTIGNEKERERVYDTIFRLPWRCELLIEVGYFVCLDTFLSLLIIMPVRILAAIWRVLKTWRFQRPSAAELSDFSCFIVLACGVGLLQRTDISLIYHMLRGQGTIKLYVVYNVLEIFDKLCQNFGGDVLQTLFNSADRLASCSQENVNFWLRRYVCDQVLAAIASTQAITLSTCIVAHNNALLALLVSNNFAEIKSNVFKRFSKDNIHNLVYHDSIERFHISSFVLFVLAQNILEAEHPWFGNFLYNALLVFICEVMIDIIKHSFIAKFNDVKPIAYSEFLEDLCNQTLNIQREDGKKNLTFVPIAPACVVIRVLTPVYAANLPYGPFPWKLLCILFLSLVTYIMLASVKMMVGMGLRKHATWYINRCRKKKHHLHAD